jgi:hypothetical protein
MKRRIGIDEGTSLAIKTARHYAMPGIICAGVFAFV